MTDYSFVDCHIAKENIGEHEPYNGWINAPMPKQIEEWQRCFPDCTPIGICYDDSEAKYDRYRPMVFEDADGHRFYTHWDVTTYEEYKEAGLL
jgi:hypothetical protein